MSYVSKPEEVFKICGKTVKSFTVLPLSKIECKEDSECEEDEYCNTFSIYKCRKLECNPNETAVNHSCVISEPEKIVIINWGNVILTAGFISLAVVLLFLFIRKKQRHEGEDYIDMTTGFSEEKETLEKEERERKEGEYKEYGLDKDNKEIEESSKNLKEDKSKKEKKNKEIKDSVKKLKQQDESKKEVGGDKEIKKKKSKPKKAKNNKKKYKRVKQNKTYDTVPGYIVDEQKEETKKTGQEIEDRGIEIMDYSGYEDDDEENRDPFN